HHLRGRYAGDAGEAGRDVVVGEASDALVRARRVDRQVNHRGERRVEREHERTLGVDGQAAHRREIELLADVLLGVAHVSTPGELGEYDRRALGAGRGDLVDARDRLQGLLDRPADQLLHAVRI